MSSDVVGTWYFCHRITFTWIVVVTKLCWWNDKTGNFSDTLCFFISFNLPFLWFLNRFWEERWQKACWMIRVFIDFFWKYFCQKQANTALIALLTMVVLAPPGYLTFKWGASTSSVTFCQSLWCLTCVNGSVHHFVMCIFQSVIVFGRDEFPLTVLPPNTLDRKKLDT